MTAACSHRRKKVRQSVSSAFLKPPYPRPGHSNFHFPVMTKHPYSTACVFIHSPKRLSYIFLHWPPKTAPLIHHQTATNSRCASIRKVSTVSVAKKRSRASFTSAPRSLTAPQSPVQSPRQARPATLSLRLMVPPNAPSTSRSGAMLANWPTSGSRTRR